MASCVPSPKSSTATSGSSSSANAPYYWNSAFPKTVYISDAFSAGEATHINSMGTAWETSVNNYNFFTFPVGRTAEITPVTSLDDFYDDGILAIYKASAAWPTGLPTYALAVTQLYGRRYNTGSASEFVDIEHADIIINEKFYNFDTTMDSNDFDFRTVMLHEMGHFLGLQHNTTTARASTVMYPNINGDEEKQAPFIDDKVILADTYNITLPLTPGLMAATADRPSYSKAPGDLGEGVKIVFELRADGDCVHRIDGVEKERHRVKLK